MAQSARRASCRERSDAYARRKPENGLLYQTVAKHWPGFREKLEEAFGGVLRHFVLSGPGLHDDDDPRHLSVLTDDERPLVFYGEKGRETQQKSGPADD